MQEARNTDKHASTWVSARLRDNAVSFVSAGNLTRDELPRPPHQDSNSSAEDDKDDEPAPQDFVGDESPRDIGMTETTVEIAQATESVHLTERSNNANGTGLGSDLSSDEDEVIFSGRKAPIFHQLTKDDIVRTVPETSQNPVTATLPSQTKQPASVEPSSDSLPAAPAWAFKGELSDASENAPAPHNFPSALQHPPTASEAEQASRPHRTMNHRYRKTRRAQRQVQQEDEDAILQDYIANISKQEDDEDEEDQAGRNKPQRRNEHFRFYDGASDSHVKVQTKSLLPKAEPPQQAIDWSSADLEDFDDLSTTDEEVTSIGQVLRHRERPSGLQYLVMAAGQSASDAKWILQSKLVSTSAVEEISVYEEIRNLQIEFQEDSESDSDSDSPSDSEQEALEDLNDDIESEAEENTRVHARTLRMTDEEIALALAKQEELGMGSDELLLFNGQQIRDSPDVGMDDEFASTADFIPFSLSKHTSNRNRSKRNRRQRDSFPSAAAFADALDQDPYGAFDVMDFDRPSLRSTRKGRKGSVYPFDLDLSDDELRDHLANTWTKDREKKAARKRERMDARAALLLDASERSEPAVIKAEIRQFLCDEDADDLRLAPMPSDLRAGVHRLAKSLKLGSRSEGKEGVGAGRFPVLSKTPHTPWYTVDTISEIDALLNLRKFFPKYGGGHYRGPNAKAGKLPGLRKGRDKGGFGAASYANGEVVGGTAPELGVENKGRAMLEKMGWSTGMGIGKEGNEGGLEHIKHVVKTNKAGLG